MHRTEASGVRPNDPSPSGSLPADNHSHTQWSWDASDTGSMLGSCERALAIGLPAIAFTEHVDHADWDVEESPPEDAATIAGRVYVTPFDVEGYRASIAECRERFPDLRILSGLETGEPHLFPRGIGRILDSGPFDRVLGSLHAIRYDGTLLGPSRALAVMSPDDLLTRYAEELLTMVRGSERFEVLAHIDYARRYLPPGTRYDEKAYEESHRAVFRELASSGRALEVNTASPLMSARMLSWWYDEGGRAVSFGSDAHEPARVGHDFALAVSVVEAAGFHPGRGIPDPYDFWRR